MRKNLTHQEQDEFKRQNRERAAAWQLANRERAAARKREWYLKNKQRVIDAAKEWAKQNPEKIKRGVDAYQKKNKATILRKSRQYYKKNKEKITIQNKEYREKNKELVNQRVRASQKKNPLRLRVNKYKRRSLEKTGKVTLNRINELMVSQKGMCVYCSTPLGHFHVDHIIPLSRGGDNNDENVQLLCPSCNWKKGNKLPDEFERMNCGLGV